MKISYIGLDLIKSYETLQLTAYRALKTEKYLTIGYGHYGPDVKEGQTITKEEATELLQKDVQTAENELNQLLRQNVLLTQNQFDALCSLVFNIGVGNFRKSTLRKKLLNHIQSVDCEFMKWVYSGGHYVQGLYNRRKKEVELFCS